MKINYPPPSKRNVHIAFCNVNIGFVCVVATGTNDAVSMKTSASPNGWETDEKDRREIAASRFFDGLQMIDGSTMWAGAFLAQCGAAVAATIADAVVYEMLTERENLVGGE